MQGTRADHGGRRHLCRSVDDGREVGAEGFRGHGMNRAWNGAQDSGLAQLVYRHSSYIPFKTSHLRSLFHDRELPNVLTFLKRRVDAES
jgi:hypothetical protein